MIVIESKRKRRITLEKNYPNAVMIDVTSNAADEFIRFSPLYPNGDIPVPGMVGVYSESVEGIWQGLKVFEVYMGDPVLYRKFGVDYSKFQNASMKNLKRTFNKFGPVHGHKLGNEYLSYLEARKKIYVTSYYWVLEHKCADLIERLRTLSKEKTVVLLDYDLNPDINNPREPLSHASLIKRYIEEHP